jgi:hypothetical protein
VPFDVEDAGLGPTVFRARTAIEYVVPFARPVIVKLPVVCPLDDQEPPPSEEYSTSVTADPPFDPRVALTARVWLPGVTELRAGAAGTVATSASTSRL